MKNFYLLTGSVFSFVYIFAGIAVLSQKLDFGLQPSFRIVIGSGILAYGLFRLYMFYRRIRAGREDENN
jgi:uncharacterized membrane protein